MVDDDLRPLKSCQTCLSVPVCANDDTSSKPTTPGRDVADVNAQTTGCVVSACGSVRCKTCKHISQGSSNVTKKSYEVISHGTSKTCSSENVVYLITCKVCHSVCG